MKFVYLATAVALTATSTSAAALYANSIVWSQGVAADGVVNGASRTDPDNALGAPDGKFLSLSLGGWAVFGFSQAFGGSASVVEVTFNCPEGSVGFCGSYEEEVEVLTGDSFNGDLTGFTSQGSIQNGDAQAGKKLTLVPGSYSWLALRDISPKVSGRDGFDVDSVLVETVGSSVVAPVPLPTSTLMLGGGLIGLGLVGRRRG